MSEFREIGGASKYVNIAPKGVPAFKSGDVVVEGTFNRTFAGKFGLQHEFKVNGETVSLNGFTALDRKMESVEAGNLVRVVYLGKKPSKKRPGKDFHDCKVLVATASTPVFNAEVSEATNQDDESFLD